MRIVPVLVDDTRPHFYLDIVQILAYLFIIVHCFAGNIPWWFLAAYSVLQCKGAVIKFRIER